MTFIPFKLMHPIATPTFINQASSTGGEGPGQTLFHHWRLEQVMAEKGYHPNVQENHLFVAPYSLVIETIIKTFIYLLVIETIIKHIFIGQQKPIFKTYIFIGHRQ